MKKIMIWIIATVLMLGGCSGEKDTSSDLYDSLPNNVNDAATSGMVDDAFFLTGELKKIGDNKVLMDADNIGLIWVSFDQEVNLDIPVKSIVKARFNGVIMESYPAQANGFTLEVIELFSEEAIFTKDELDQLLADGDVNQVIVWNDMKDQVAYATVDLATMDESYRVFISDLYVEGAIEVAYVQNELPDLNWYFDRLEVQTSNGSYEFGPDFQAIEEVQIIEGKSMSEAVPTAPAYNLELTTYTDNDKNISIDYYNMTGLLGELTQSYINQSLYKIVDIYGRNYTDVEIKATILKADDFLTIAYEGKHLALDYDITHFMTIDVHSSVELTMDNLVKDMDALKVLFEDQSGYVLEDQEGVYPFLEGDHVVFTFVPTDDMAERVYVSFPILEVAPILNMTFEGPAS